MLFCTWEQQIVVGVANVFIYPITKFYFDINFFKFLHAFRKPDFGYLGFYWSVTSERVCDRYLLVNASVSDC